MIAKGTTGAGHTFLAFDSSGRVWNGAAFVAFVFADRASYKITATELAPLTGMFNGTLPADTVKWFLFTLTSGDFADPISDPWVIADEGDVVTGGGSVNRTITITPRSIVITD
jgi:hypothetical protein